jgi:hypothetical protein
MRNQKFHGAHTAHVDGEAVLTVGTTQSMALREMTAPSGRVLNRTRKIRGSHQKIAFRRNLVV